MSPRAPATWPLTCPSLKCGPDSLFTGCCPWRPHSRCRRNQSLDLPSPRPHSLFLTGVFCPSWVNTTRPGNHGIGWGQMDPTAELLPGRPSGHLRVRSLCPLSGAGFPQWERQSQLPQLSPGEPDASTHRHCPALYWPPHLRFSSELQEPCHQTFGSDARNAY